MKRNVMKSILCSLLIVALLAAPVSALAASKVAYILKVNVPATKGAYIHSGTGNGDKDVIGSLRHGTYALYYGKKVGQMLYVMSPEGKTGYVYQGNMKTYGAVNIRQLYLTSSSTGVYRKVKGSMRKIGSVGAGVPVVMFNANGKWAYVRSLTGAAAYIPVSALKSLS